jgi:ATP-binding cassette subfamily B protein
MDNNEQNISIHRRITVCVRVLKVAFRANRPAFIGYFVGALIEIGCMLLSIYATAKLASLLATFVSAGKTDYIWFWLFVDIAALTLTGISFWIMSFTKQLVYFSIVQWGIMSYLSTLSCFDIADFYDTDLRNKMNKVGGSYIWQMPQLSQSCLDLLYGILRFLAIVVVVSQISLWLVPLIALFLIPSLIGESRLAKMQWFVWDSKGDYRHIFWGLEYIIKGAKGQMELRSTQATKFVLNKVKTMNTVFYTEQSEKYRHASRSLVPSKVFEVVGTAIGSVMVLRQLLSHTISLDRYFFLSGALLRIGSALNTVFGTLSYMQEYILLADTYFELIDKQPRIVDFERPIILEDKAPSIVFEDVSFAYSEKDSPVFENLNIEINAGEHVALVGENGAGKSTLIKLLLRFYVPTKGKILINGYNLNEIAIESWYKGLATLFQDFNHYPLTISENIEIGRSNAAIDKTKLEQSAKFGSVDQLIKNYEHGWDTVLDSSFEKGVEPSGGQWQRVALARAFYRNAEMIILDEPTSAIDAKAEYDIFNNIFKQFNKKTALIVSHRFSTVRRADRIIVLEHGKVIETGSHKQLLKNKGLYHELFTKQAEGYKD